MQERETNYHRLKLILLIIWSTVCFSLLANFIVYSIFPSEQLYNAPQGGTFEGGLIRVGLSASWFLPIAGFLTLLLILNAQLNQIYSNTIQKISESRRQYHYLRLFIFIMNTGLSLPWILANIGIHISDVPILQLIFIGEQPISANNIAAVHIGNHHGYDGYIFLLWALICSIEVRASKSEIANFKGILIHSILFATCIGMASYGMMAIIEDFLNEQIIKRGYNIPGYSSFGSFFGSMEFFATLGGIILISMGINIIYLRIRPQSRIKILNQA